MLSQIAAVQVRYSIQHVKPNLPPGLYCLQREQCSGGDGGDFSFLRPIATVKLRMRRRSDDDTLASMTTTVVLE